MADDTTPLTTILSPVGGFRMVGRIKYDQGKQLGNGTGGFVFSGLLDGEREVAVKRIQVVELLPGTKQAERELKALSQLSHPNVVRLLHDEKTDEFV